MAQHSIRGRTRRRAAAAASGLAALALVLAACGEEGTAEDAVGGATSAVGSVAAEATSAIGDATDENGNRSQNPDEEFLRDIRAVGVNTEDEQDYLTRGRDACASLAGGRGYVDVIRQYDDAHPEAPVTEAPVVVSSAVKAFCSQHLPQIGQNEGGDQGGEG